jgi:hypothetical protein
MPAGYQPPYLVSQLVPQGELCSRGPGLTGIVGDLYQGANVLDGFSRQFPAGDLSQLSSNFGNQVTILDQTFNRYLVQENGANYPNDVYVAYANLRATVAALVQFQGLGTNAGARAQLAGIAAHIDATTRALEQTLFFY